MIASRFIAAALAFCALTACNSSIDAQAESQSVVPAAVLDNPKAPGKDQVAVLAGGCFWGVQGVYQHVKGVRNVLSGYSGGDKATAEYDVVSSGRTGHAESVQIVFDPNEISYGEILRIFFTVAHDPTQLNRQGPDAGPQYRSVVFYADEQQQKIATAYVAQLDAAHAFRRPIATRIDKLNAFYPAEDYHQDYLVLNPRSAYIVFHDMPKIADLKRTFPAHWREEAVTVASVARTSKN